MSIGATDHNDELAYFTNYGATTVDLFAPGVDILSTTPGNTYSVFSGTSMATPAHRGRRGACLGKVPRDERRPDQGPADEHRGSEAGLAGKCVTGGRLNALFAISEPDTIAPGMIADLATENPGSNTMGLTWTATGDDGGTGTASSYDVRYSMAPITEANWGSATPASGEPDPGAGGKPPSR